MPRARSPGSDNQTLVNHWLQHLTQRTGVDLKLDEEGGCTIGHASGLDCAIEVPGNGSVYVSVALLAWEPEAYPDRAERCLVASFMGMETGGAAFGVDPLESMLILWQERPLVSLDEMSFFQLVANILNHGDSWRKKLVQADEAAAFDSSHRHRLPVDFSFLRV